MYTSTPSVVIAANVRPGLIGSESTPPWPKIHGFSINTTSCPASGEYTLQPPSPTAISITRYFIDLPFQKSNSSGGGNSSIRPDTYTAPTPAQLQTERDRPARQGRFQLCDSLSRPTLRSQRTGTPQRLSCRVGTAAWGAAALTAYYALIVVILMNGRVVLAHYAEFGTYSGIAEQLAITAGGLIVYSASAGIDAALAARLTRVGQMAFGVCALLFGGAHFVYMNLTAPLVPKWLPPTQEFWAYATGVGHIAAGVAILTGVQARLAAILLTAMFASFTPLVHVPMLLADPSSH